MDKIRVLNLYAGIGGNRKLWPDDKIEVTAVEIEPKIAKIYQDFFPNDHVIVADAHQFLLDHFKEFDFIWSSPPCPTHSRMNSFQQAQGYETRYPDMRLYQEIILLKSWFKGLWVVENVISYYEPLIKPQLSNNHYFWANFKIPNLKAEPRGIKNESRRETHHSTKEFNFEEKIECNAEGFDAVLNMVLPNKFKRTIINNCVNPKLALTIFNMAFRDRQKTLKDAVE